MQFKTAFTFGRFNLLHRGHIDLFKQMQGGAEHVLVGISTGAQNLTWHSRRKIIRQVLLNDPDFKSFDIIGSRSPFGLLEHIHDDPENTVIYLGHDQFELGQTMSREFGCATICIPRLTSSSTLRHLIDTDQWSLLAREVPQSIINDVIRLRQQELCQSSL